MKRTPKNFPRMKDRAAGRHARTHYVRVLAALRGFTTGSRIAATLAQRMVPALTAVGTAIDDFHRALVVSARVQFWLHERRRHDQWVATHQITRGSR